MTDLVAACENLFDRLWVPLNAPAGNEECLTHVKTAERIDQSRHADERAVTQHGRKRHSIWGGLPLINVKETFPVHIEREGHGAPCAAGPFDPVFNHSQLPSAAKN